MGDRNAHAPLCRPSAGQRPAVDFVAAFLCVSTAFPCVFEGIFLRFQPSFLCVSLPFLCGIHCLSMCFSPPFLAFSNTFLCVFHRLSSVFSTAVSLRASRRLPVPKPAGTVQDKPINATTITEGGGIGWRLNPFPNVRRDPCDYNVRRGPSLSSSFTAFCRGTAVVITAFHHLCGCCVVSYQLIADRGYFQVTLHEGPGHHCPESCPKCGPPHYAADESCPDICNKHYP